METGKLFDCLRARVNRFLCRTRRRASAIASLMLLIGSLDFATVAGAANIWGRLANPGFENQRIKATFFFAGPARDGSPRYSCKPLGSNVSTYTLTPNPTSTHLNWSDGDRGTVMNMLSAAGINVIAMSSWGEDFLPCNDGWVTGAAPMQVSPEAQDELFDMATRKSLLIAPLIESRSTWTMREEFPTWSDGRVSPGLVSQIVNLIHRYLQNPATPQWAGTWARVYDQSGRPRYAVGVIHAASDNLGSLPLLNDWLFARGFDRVAAEVAHATGGVQVGFFIDATPAEGSLSHASFKPSPRFTAPFLLSTASLLGIQGFAPEIFVDVSGDDDILAWKRDFVRRWISAGIPVLVDVSPGYDGSLVFGASSHARYGLTAEWFDGMTAIVNDYGRNGMIYNSWNGYTEAMVGTPTVERGAQLYDWLKSLNAHRDIFVDWATSGPESGTAAEPYRTIGPANDVSSNGDLIYIRTGAYPSAITFTNQLTLVPKGGSVTIGAP